jgi:hypothetical protein
MQEPLGVVHQHRLRLSLHAQRLAGGMRRIGVQRHEVAVAGDVTAYLADTPAACRTFSGNRHAFTESGDVQRNPQLRAPRELPVPAEIAPSGRAFMGAHFKIAQSATISPRMHYLDATSRTQKIYVGYIGPHLPLSTS